MGLDKLPISYVKGFKKFNTKKLKNYLNRKIRRVGKNITDESSNIFKRPTKGYYFD